MSEPARKRLASILIAVVLIAVWAFVEWRAQPPAPPNGKVLPWEQATVKVGQ